MRPILREGCDGIKANGDGGGGCATNHDTRDEGHGGISPDGGCANHGGGSATISLDGGTQVIHDGGTKI